MNDHKGNGPLQRAVGEHKAKGIRSYDVNTDIVNWLTRGAPRMTKKAWRKTRKQRPWNSHLVVVHPVPGYPGLVETLCCPACGGVHRWPARYGPSDPGIRTLPCRSEDRVIQYRFPDAFSIIIAGLGSWGTR